MPGNTGFIRRFITVAMLAAATAGSGLLGTATADNTNRGTAVTVGAVPSDATVAPAAFADHYPWQLPESNEPTVAPLASYASTPADYERVSLEPGTFPAFIRHLPIRLDRTTVKAYNGKRLGSPSAGVVALPLIGRDLQQCADTIIRLRAEYLWQAGHQQRIGFHFTSGDRSTWPAWREGERFRITGARVERYQGAARDTGRANFRAYLEHLFTYAGTLSLSRDARALRANEPTMPGDFFLDPGSPGHVVLVLDVAVDEDGDRVALIGQSFMPAQEFHLVEGNEGRVWFDLPRNGGQLETPSWEPFGRDQRWRFE